MNTAELEKTENAESTAPVKENKMGVLPVGKLVFSMSLPMMVSMLVQALYNIVDSLFVSQINQNAFTGVSLAFPLQNLMIAVGVGTGVGVNANLARALGEKKFEKANKFARHGIFLAVCSYLAFLAVTLCFTKVYFRAQTDVAATIRYGEQYLYIAGGLSVGSFMQIMNERLLQSTGKTVLSMFTQGLGAVINIVLDPILIFGIGPFPKMGVAGAAVATVVGQICGALFGIYLNVTRNHEINLNMRGFRPEEKFVNSIYAIGVPSIIMASVTSVMTFLLNLILAGFGALKDTLQSVLGAYFKLQSFIFMPVFGLNNGTVPIISYNYGAGKRTRLVKTIKISALFATSIMLLGLLLMQVFPAQMLDIFKANDEMLRWGVPALRIISVSFIFAGVAIVFSSAFQSLGHPINSMIISIARQLVVLVPAAFLLAKTGNPDMVWWSFPIAEIMSLSASIFFMIKIHREVIRHIPDNE
ncbi:mATE efflux family protein [Ruminococcus sp. CAG:579]|nr:mATE efflux family protein [Ruminococcus sp. CAG:579]